MQLGAGAVAVARKLAARPLASEVRLSAARVARTVEGAALTLRAGHVGRDARVATPTDDDTGPAFGALEIGLNTREVADALDVTDPELCVATAARAFASR